MNDNTSLNLLLVDDEPLARSDLRAVLNEMDREFSIYEADSVKAAKRTLKLEQIDIVFLDIQMPGETGFDLLKFIEPPINIIFVTAFDEYAIKAFEANALDYLMKPVNIKRLERAFHKIYLNPAEKKVISRKLNTDDSIFLKLDNEYRFIKIDSILKIESADDYTLIFTNNGAKMLTLKTMKEWESRLPEQMFCRIHRSTIVNFLNVTNIEPYFNNSYSVSITGIQEPVIMSRRYFSCIKERMG